MENGKKDILLHLYGDSTDASDLRTLLKDEELKTEYATLSEAKFKLDHMNKQRPNQAVIDRILAAAATEAGLPDATSRRDRPAIGRNTQLKRVLIPALTIAAAIVFGIGIGWFSASPESVSPENPAVAEISPNDPVPPESLFRFVPSRQNGLTQASTADPRLAWDEAATIQDLHRRIEDMRPTDRLDWGERAVPLESVPGSNGNGLRLTGQKK